MDWCIQSGRQFWSKKNGNKQPNGCQLIKNSGIGFERSNNLHLGEIIQNSEEKKKQWQIILDSDKNSQNSEEKHLRSIIFFSLIN